MEQATKLINKSFIIEIHFFFKSSFVTKQPPSSITRQTVIRLQYFLYTSYDSFLHIFWEVDAQIGRNQVFHLHWEVPGKEAHYILWLPGPDRRHFLCDRSITARNLRCVFAPAFKDPQRDLGLLLLWITSGPWHSFRKRSISVSAARGASKGNFSMSNPDECCF